MVNGWTGGQYSIARAVLGIAVVVGAWQVIAASPSPWIVGLATGAMVLGVMLTLGWRDRIAAIALLPLVIAEAVARVGDAATWNDPATWTPYASAAILAVLLAAHACQPAAPFGSLAARGRPDPGATWRVRPGVFLALWVLLSIGYLAGGLLMLFEPQQTWRLGDALATRMMDAGMNVAMPQLLRALTWIILGLHLAFAPLALVRRLRPWLWLMMLLVNVLLIALFDDRGLRSTLLLAHLFTFVPAWIPPAARKRGDEPEWSNPQPETIFYDGHCGLCHRWVRFALSEDRAAIEQDQETFRFSPLQSRAFEAAVPAEVRKTLPDSIVVQTHDHRLLTRSDAIAHIATRLGGLWRLLGTLLRLLPRFIRDGGYNTIARIRHRIWKRPSDACPMLPPELRRRFIYDAMPASH